MSQTASSPILHALQVRQIRREAEGIHSFELVDPEGQPLPAFEAGAHLDVHIPTAQGVQVRQYSLCNDPAERHRYVIAVLREAQGRGGSQGMHTAVQVSQTLQVSTPRNHFALAQGTGPVTLLGGGIGITPLKAMAHTLVRAGRDFVLHYCARSTERLAFHDALLAAFGPQRVRFHLDQGRPSEGLDLATALRDVAPGAQLYYCGPAGFMAACAQASAHWPEGSVHCEHFKAPEPAAGTAPAAEPGSFVVQLARSGQVFTVRAEQTLVEGLAGVGVEVPTSCISGLCGTCKVDYLAGEVEHLDHILGDDEKASCLTACVSRGKAGTLVLDL